MKQKDGNTGTAASATRPRDERLKEALRANLHRRKFQARARASDEAAATDGQKKG